MKTQIFVHSCKEGDVIRAVTETATYFFVITSPQVANVWRQGNGKPCAVLLGKRRMGAVIVEHEPFTSYDSDGEPVSVILPTDVSRVPALSIPLPKTNGGK